MYMYTLYFFHFAIFPKFWDYNRLKMKGTIKRKQKDFLNFIHSVLLSTQQVSSSSRVCGMQTVFTFTEISPAERQTLSKKSDIHKEEGREPQECHRKWPDFAGDRTLWEQMNAENARFQNRGNLAKCNFCHLTLWTNLILWIGLIRSCCF